MRLAQLTAAAILAAVAVITPVEAAWAADGHCDLRSSKYGVCATGQVSGAGVDLTGHGRGRDTVSDAPAGTAPPEKPAVEDDVPAPAPYPLPRDYFDHCDVREPVCQSQFFHMSSAPSAAAAPAPGVSLEDVASFVPRSASIRSQPNGWAVIGTPVNLLTDAAAQVVDGTLLGRPAQVRFVPVAFGWDHGDGTTTTVSGPGSSWKQLGQPDFTPTETSHVYAQVGERQVTLTISYAPSYRFDGGGWQRIPGTVPVTVGPVVVRVLEASTVLVGGPCGSADAGPGC